MCPVWRPASGISNKRMSAEWKTVTRAINAVGSENRIMAEIKNKWSDVKLEIKKHTSVWMSQSQAHRDNGIFPCQSCKVVQHSD